VEQNSQIRKSIYQFMKKTAIVTGASRGMGLEWVRQLHKNGYDVVLTARTEDKAAAAVVKLKEEGIDVVGKALDVGSEASIVNLATWFSMKYDKLDLLINNAGLNSKDESQELFSKSMNLVTLSPDEVIRHMRVNALGPVLMVKHLRGLLKKSDQPMVLSISSWLGSLTKKDFGGHYSYSSSKCALNMMNSCMALELKDENIIAVVVNPGWVQTEMGGSKAPLTPVQSIKGMIDNVVNRITIDATGKFFQWDGSIHPW
jgi:NAD(P)-dependent dehydrogenase (short-subunit alcohol dehydrogenase family)